MSLTIVPCRHSSVTITANPPITSAAPIQGDHAKGLTSRRSRPTANVQRPKCHQSLWTRGYCSLTIPNSPYRSANSRWVLVRLHPTSFPNDPVCSSHEENGREPNESRCFFWFSLRRMRWAGLLRSGGATAALSNGSAV